MAKQWVKVWGEKLISSVNYRKNLKLAEKGTYTGILLMARTDGPHAGLLCQPNGRPYSINDIADTLHTTDNVISQHLKKMISLGMVEYKGEWPDPEKPGTTISVYYLRKYRELTKSKTNEVDISDEQNPEQVPNMLTTPSRTSSQLVQEGLLTGKDLRQKPDTEEKRREETRGEESIINTSSPGSVEPREAKIPLNFDPVCPEALKKLGCYSDLAASEKFEHKGIKSLWQRWDKLYVVWTTSYPAVDVLAQIRLAYAWDARQENNMKKVNKVAFIGRWLANAQGKADKGVYNNGTGGQRPQTNRNFDSSKGTEGQYDHLK